MNRRRSSRLSQAIKGYARLCKNRRPSCKARITTHSWLASRYRSRTRRWMAVALSKPFKKLSPCSQSVLVPATTQMQTFRTPVRRQNLSLARALTEQHLFSTTELESRFRMLSLFPKLRKSLLHLKKLPDNMKVTLSWIVILRQINDRKMMLSLRTNDRKLD